MQLFIKLSKILPVSIRKKLPAPMIDTKRKKVASTIDNGIELNLENLLICAQYCGTCPSFPHVSGEALYCATGASSAVIEEKGCNCLSCPIYNDCGKHDSTIYYCSSGAIPKKQPNENGKEQNHYLARFTKKLFQSSSSITSIHQDDTSDKNVKVQFLGDKEVIASSSDSLLKTSLKNKIPHVHVCGGNARCSTCRVIVVDGLENCFPKNEKESILAKTKGFSDNIRLACQTKTLGDISVRRLVLDKKDESEAITEGKKGLSISGTEINAAILFSDIRSFTSFSEKNLPYDIVHLLNRYFDLIGVSIDSNGGYIDKYMGDGIMVIFGLEDKEQHPASLALRAAQGMLDALGEFNLYLQKHFHHEFEIGIGVHYGALIVGNLGYHKKMEFTAIGDTVNTASRIESLNKKFKTKVLVSKEVYELTKGEFRYKKGFKTHVKGKEGELLVYLPDFGEKI